MKKNIDILIPVKDEAKNISQLVKRIDSAMAASHFDYRIICIDDHSTDTTVKELEKLSHEYPINVYKKEGKLGKAYSILEGVRYSTSDWVLMIDADLQYPPEAIPAMLAMAKKDYGVVIGNRKVYKSTLLRRFASRLNRFIFGWILLGLNYDVQSGLKLFRREIVDYIDPGTVSAWSLDLPLLYTARELGFTIGSVDIAFERRKNGESKISFAQTALEIAFSATKLRLKHFRKRAYILSPDNQSSMLGAGLIHRRKRFITHTTLSAKHSAMTTLNSWQKFLLVLIVLIGLWEFTLHTKEAAIAAVAMLSAVYFFDVFFNLFLVVKSLAKPPEIVITKKELLELDESKMPVYSILSPLYREANVVPQFLQAIKALDYPRQKLDVILLLEEDDKETIAATKQMHLPSYVRVVVVPDSLPKTKPKACNYGLALARGEYIVIYDAEDMPEPTQLKKAYLAFDKLPPDALCLQAKLNYYNPHDNLLTRLFSAEYSLWFDMILPGLQAIGTAIPLGGTSNHFRTADLKKLEGWDAFNVTEDCDLGVRLFKKGFKTAIFDSTTLEEANSNAVNWLRQRSRWIKGYIQTYLVHMRDPIDFIRTNGWHMFIFQLVVGGKLAFMLINPLLWLATIAYFSLYAIVGPTIEALYPPVVFYMAVTSLVFGNFLFLYYYMIGCARRGHWSVIKFVFFVPFYWLMVSISAVVAWVQLVVKPHYWEKTHHGLHIGKETSVKTVKPSSASVVQIKRLRGLVLSGFTTTTIMVAASILANIFNFLYNAYLVRNITAEEYGLVALFGSLLYLSQVFTISISGAVTYRSAYLFGKYGQAVTDFWSYCRKKSLAVALCAAGLWMVFIPFAVRIFQGDSLLPFILFSPIWIVGTMLAVDSGFLSGNLRFKVLAIVVTTEAVTKFVMAYLLVGAGAAHFVYAAIPLSMFVAMFLSWLAIRKMLQPTPQIEPREVRRFPVQFFTTSVLLKISTVAFLSLDVILAKFFLSPTDAGNYAFLSLVGKIIFFFGALFAQFITPLVSRAEGAGKSSQKIFHGIMAATIVASLVGFVSFGIFGGISLPFLFGSRSQSILPFITLYTLAIAYFTIASSIVNYHQIKRQHFFVFVSFLAALAEVAGIGLFHTGIVSLAIVLLTTGALYLLSVSMLHFFYGYFRVLGTNLLDFFGLFQREISSKLHGSGQTRILIFNWRDSRHVWAGGAEVYLHELAKRWVQNGNLVTLFCGNDGKNSRYEVVDGVEVVRRGGFFTVYIWAALYYLFRFRGRYDVVIDSENGLPFFTPLYVRRPVFLLIHHVHQEVFQRYLPFPLSHLARWTESKLMPLVYRDKSIVTVSESSRREIQSLGLGKTSHVEVIHPGIDPSLFAPTKKSSTPTILYLGRLKPYKNIDVAIEAFARVSQTYPGIRMIIAGEGESRTDLKKLSQKLGVYGYCDFLGRVTESKKAELLAKSWICIQPSSIEGWGLTIIEANRSGTAVVASKVNGLKDSVVHAKTGFLVEAGNAQAFAQFMERLIGDKDLRNQLEKNALSWSQRFSWEKSADIFYSLLTGKLADEYGVSQSKNIGQRKIVNQNLWT